MDESRTSSGGEDERGLDEAELEATQRVDPSAVIERLDRELEECADDSSAPPAERARAFNAIESQLLELEARQRGTAAWLTRTRGNLDHWHNVVERLGLERAAAEAAQHEARLLTEQVRFWRTRADATIETARELPRQRVHATELWRALIASAPLLAEAIQSPNWDELRDPLVEGRAALRAALELEIADEPLPLGEDRPETPTAEPSEDEPTQTHWATQLLDTSAETLTLVDTLPPEAASESLRLALDNVEWFAEHVVRDRGPLRSRIKYRARRLRAEVVERDLQTRLESLFGERFVGILERTVLALIVLVVTILGIELTFNLPTEWTVRLMWVDAAACVVFLGEFFLKLALVEGRAHWFMRHFLVDFLPSIPFGLILHWQTIDGTRAARLARLFRLQRAARYLRILAPVLRGFRALAFLARGMDRLVRSRRTLLNRDLVLTPDRKERARARARRRSAEYQAAGLRTRLEERWEELLHLTPEEERDEVARLRTDVIGSPPAARSELDEGDGRTGREERTLLELIIGLEETGTDDVEVLLGKRGVARTGRVLRALGRPPLRWVPIIGRALPRPSPRVDDAELLAQGARSVGHELRKHYDRLYYWADLHGTITPSEVVDRAGTALVKSSIRPATRLLLFGALFLIVRFLIDVLVPTHSRACTRSWTTSSVVP